MVPVLLSDSSSCRNELGRILYANPNEWNVHMNIVSTNTMSSFFTSHIEYQMSVCAIPCNSLATDIRFFDMWTRFRDVRRLWEQLADLHKKLHLHGSFPQFAEGVIFGNQNAEIIGQRMSSITLFLNYVLAHPVLRQSKVLQDYFEKAQEILKPSNHKDPLEPQRQCSLTEDSSLTSFGANMVHVSKYKDQDSKVLFISDHKDPLATVSGATAQLYVQAHPVPAAVVQRNSTTHAQEKSVANSAPLPTNATLPTTSQTSIGYSYVLPTYYCVELSQQPRFAQASRTDNGAQQHSCS